MVENVPLMKIGTGASAIMSHTLIKRIPVNYTPGTKIMFGERLLYETGRTISDGDEKTFYCILKAYTDNKFDQLNTIKKNIKSGTRMVNDLDIDTAVFDVDVKQISGLAYGKSQRARADRLLESMEKMSELKIYLLSTNGEVMGFVNLVSGAQLSKDKKTLQIAMNKSFLIDIAKEMIQYNFPKMLSLKGRAFRLYVSLQQKKYYNPKTKRYGYGEINHQELCDIMNLHDRRAKYQIAEAFKEIGLKFSLRPNGNWCMDKLPSKEKKHITPEPLKMIEKKNDDDL